MCVSSVSFQCACFRGYILRKQFYRVCSASSRPLSSQVCDWTVFGILFSFHLYVGPGDQTYDTGIHSKPLYPLIHLITLLDCIWEVPHRIRVFCDLVRKVCPGRSLVASSGGNCQAFPGLSFLIWRKGPSTLFLQHLM